MAEQEPSDHEPSGDMAALFEVVTLYQHVWSRLQETTELSVRTVLKDELKAIQERLLPLVRRPLEQVAFQWWNDPATVETHGSIYQRDMLQSLVIGFYLILIEELPDLRIDPQRNLAALIKSVVHRRLIDKQRSRYGRKPRASDEDTLRNDSSYSWARRMRDLPLDEMLEKLPDKADDAIQELYRRECLEVAWKFWQQTCSAEDLAIIRLRMNEPPVSFRDIVLHLGWNVTEAAARKRYERLLDRARSHLRECGLLDDDM